MYSVAVFLCLIFFSAYLIQLNQTGVVKLFSLFVLDSFYLYCGGSVFIGFAYLLCLSPAILLIVNQSFRRDRVSSFFYDFVQKQGLKINETEAIALNAGGAAFEKAVFRNESDYHAHYPLNDECLTEAEKQFIDEKVSKLCAMLDEWDINMKQADLSASVWTFIKQSGFLGLVIPKRYGGHEFSALAHSIIVNKIASVSATAAVTVMVPNSLGPAELLMAYGTEAQKEYYLPRLAKGEAIPCFGLTSTYAGSDATAIKDRGTVCQREINAKKVIGIQLNFEKRYITLAPIATVIGVAFKLYDPENLLGDKTDLGITLALVDRDLPGITIGARHYPLLQSFMNGPVIGEDVFITLDDVIGGQACLGQGWRMLMESLSVGRGISLPALGNACSKTMYLSTTAYSAIREQFGRPIADFEGISALLAKQAGQAYLSEALRRMTLHAIDQHQKPALLCAISKLHMTQMGRESIEIAMDVHAGKAIQMGPSNYVAWSYLAIPVAITVEGANILTRNLIIFGQGLMRCHRYLRSLIELTTQNRTQFTESQFDETLFALIHQIITNLATVICNHVTMGFQNITKFHPEIQRYCRQHALLSAKLAVVSDLCLAIFGSNLKVKESISARLGDTLSFLTMHYAAQRYYLNHREPEEKIYFDWVSAYCFHEVERNLIRVLNNLPNRWIAMTLKGILFPWGQQFSEPSDHLNRTLSKITRAAHGFRDRIKVQVFSTPMLAMLENTFLEKQRLKVPYTQVIKAVKRGEISDTLSLEAQISLAYDLKILNDIEYKALRELSKKIMAVIGVDQFEDLKSACAFEPVARSSKKTTTVCQA